MEYSKIGMIAIILHVIINADTLFRNFEGSLEEVNKRYRYFLFAVMFFYTSDISWGVFLGLKMVPLAYINSVAFFFFMGLTVFLWVRYIRVFLNQKNLWSNVLYYLAWVLIVSVLAVIIVNIFKPILFYFTPEGEYVTLEGRHALLFVQIVLYTVVGIYTLIRAARLKDRDRFHHVTIGISGLLMAFFIFLQSMYPMTPFYSMGLLFASSVIHTFVMVDARIETSKQIGSYKLVAYKDKLTNLRNANAYSEVKQTLESDIREGKLDEFGVIIFDLNNLKLVNDTLGHDAGDKYIKDACKLICRVYEHSPIFRIGGDEFVAILTGNDFALRDSLIMRFNEMVDKNLAGGGPVVAAGMSIFDPANDSGYDSVFERADANMYCRKKELKKKNTSASE